MQQESIQSQVDTIKKATEIATQTQESALKFLRDAGIIRDEKPQVNCAPKPSK